ncbi:MAG: response regulator [bacterium]|nr:response regulator [bacterium]
MFLSLSLSLPALDPAKTVSQYGIGKWDMKSGLPGNTVYALRQTRDGYLWIGSKEGLVRFDGLDFNVFTRGNTSQLKDNDIRSLYEDGGGTLWIGTNSGGLTRYNDGTFNTFPITENKALSKIYALEEDRWGNLWIGSFNAGLTRLNLKTGTFTTFTTNHGLPHNQVKSIAKDRTGDLWVATYGGIVKIPQPGNEFEIYGSQEVLPYLKTAALYRSDTGILWIGTGGQGLIRMENRRFTAFGTAAGLPHPTVNRLYRDRNNNLWIGTDGGGLTRMSNGTFSTLSTANGLADDYVYSIYEDREGSLWVGTLGGGLHQLKDNKFTTFTTRQGLSDNSIRSFFEDQAGNLWIGTKRGGLNLMEKKANHKVTTLLTAGNSFFKEAVTCLSQDAEGILWVGTLDGLHRFKNQNKDKQLTTFTKESGLSDNRVQCMLTDSKGDTWIGTQNGLNRFNSKDRTFTTFTTKDGLSGNVITLLFQDFSGNLGIGTDGGLNRFENGIFSTLNPGAELVNSVLRCAYQDKEGVLWLGTENGLIRWQEDVHFLHTYTIESGLIENYVYSILEDEKGYLWLGGRNGISRIVKKELTDMAAGKAQRLHPSTYNEKDGMKTGWCTAAGYKTRDGRFWFPTDQGVVMVAPNHFKPDPMLTPIRIKTLTVDGESIPVRSKGIKKEPVELGPGKKRLKFDYTALTFINPQRITFKSRLNGYDSEWIDMGNLRTATFIGLSPGHYTFEVTAANPDGRWNPEPTSFSFYLRPYFYQTMWFYIFVSFFILLAVLSIHRFKVRQLRARKEKLKRLVGLQTRDLEERNIELGNAKALIEAKNRQLEEQSEKLKELDEAKSRFFANISHEFRSPLTLIMGPLERIIENVENNPDNPGKNLGNSAKMMLRNSRRLLNLVDQLLELAKFDSGKMELQAALQNIVPFVKNIVMCFESLALQNQVELTFLAETEELPLYFDPEKMERIITNLLSNAFNYTPGNGKISVLIREVVGTGYPSGCVEIAVSDTGTGIPSGQLPHIFDRFYRGMQSHEYKRKGTGIGLALAKDLMELHHGQIEVHSSVMEDTRGTEFILRLPLGTEHLQPGEIMETPGFDLAQVPAFKVDVDFSEHETHMDTGNIDDELEEAKPIILVVDDNADVRTYIRGSLEPHFNVTEAANGREGIDRAGEIIPDLVISDVMMPEVDGYQMCSRLKKDIKTSHIPIILLTAKASETSMAEGLETGADDYITKPFNSDILVIRVKNLIRLRRQLQLKFQQDMILQPGEIEISSIDREFVNELQDIIEENLSESEFNVGQLTKKLYMSRSSLNRKIRALTGDSTNRFIRSYRLKRAAQLLKSNFGNVTEVAFEVGFSSTAYFTKCFKEKFHQLPHDYQVSKPGHENLATDKHG